MPPPSSGGDHAGADRATAGQATTSPAWLAHAPRPCTCMAESDAPRLRRPQRGTSAIPTSSTSIRPRCCRRRPRRRCASTIDPSAPRRRREVVEPARGRVESRQTTHFSVIDASGNAVALTTTINDWYGSAVTVAGAGFLLNNEMDDFAAKPGTPNMYGLVQGEANAIAPGKRMLSSMTPTHRARRRPASAARDRRQRRAVHHHHGVPGDLEPPRLRPGRVGADAGAAPASPAPAGRVAARKGRLRCGRRRGAASGSATSCGSSRATTTAAASAPPSSARTGAGTGSPIRASPVWPRATKQDTT